MQLNHLSTLAVLALAGVAFQAASAVPTQQPAASTSSPSGVQQASPQEPVSRGTNAAQDNTATKQADAQDLTGTATAPSSTDSGPMDTSASTFDPSKMGRTDPSLPGIANGAPDILYQITDYLPAEYRSTLRKVSKAIKNAVDLDPAGRSDLIQRCLYEKWTALLASHGVRQLKAAVDSATAATVAVNAELAAARTNAAANPGANYGVVGLVHTAWIAKGKENVAKKAFINVVAASAVWMECVTEVTPSATIKHCPHSQYQIAGNNGEYTAPAGPSWYEGLRMAQETGGDDVRDRAFASQLCQLAENDAFYWAEQLAKDAPSSLRAVGLHALIHTVQLTEDKRTAEQVHAMLQRVSAPSGPIPLSHYYDPVVEHYLFTRNPSLLPEVDLDSLQLLSGILTRALAISKQPLPYLAPWYKADEPTELDMPHVQLPIADRIVVMRYVAERVDRSSKMAPYLVPDEESFPMIEQPGPGDAYQLLTLPDESQVVPGRPWGARLMYKDIREHVRPFDLVAGYYKADEAIHFYYAAYKDTYYPSAIVMATRSTDGTSLLKRVFAHQLGEPGASFLELSHVVSYMRELDHAGRPRGELEAWKRLGEAVMDCSKVCSKDQWPTFEKLMADKLSTFTPAQMESFEDSVWSSGAPELLKNNPAVTVLPDNQCTTFAQRDKCAAHRVASLLRQGKSAAQAN